MFKDTIKHTFEEKHLEHKPKEQKNKISHVHKQLDEELRPLTLINNSVKQITGVKGVFIKEIFMLSHLFSWDTSNIFEIYEGDKQGKQLHEDSKPILYAVARLTQCCSCNCDTMGTSEIALTTKLEENESNAPYIFVKEKHVCCGFNKAEIFINENGNQTLIGNIQEGCYTRMTINSDYINNLIMKVPCCQTDCCRVTYILEDDQKNKGVLAFQNNFCNCCNPFSYECGFPSNYDENKNTILLASVIYLGYINYQSRKQVRKLNIFD